MCSDTASPRISYSLDIVGQADTASAELHRHGSLSSYSSDPNHEFDFGLVFGHIEHEVCSAEELFENGTIVPGHMRRLSSQGITVQCECTEEEVQPLPFLSPHRSSWPANESKVADQVKGNTDHIPEINVKSDKKVQSTRSFWGFKRSSSLNSDDGNKVSLLCPLPDLSRSRSVSSVAANPNKVAQKQQRRRSAAPEIGKSSSIAAYVCPFPHKSHSMRKSHSGGGGSHYGNNGSIRVSPVLNVPPHKGSVSFFGLGCFYIRGKDKTKNTT